MDLGLGNVLKVVFALPTPPKFLKVLFFSRFVHYLIGHPRFRPHRLSQYEDEFLELELLSKCDFVPSLTKQLLSADLCILR
jgi:hypothetical protein